MKTFQEDSYIINEKGKKTAAILPIEKYERLLEDLHDLSIIADRRDEPSISFNKIKEKLHKNGAL